MKLPEGTGVVHGQRGHGRQVVLESLVRLDRHGSGVKIRDDDVVVEFHRCPDPLRARALLQLVHHLHELDAYEKLDNF